MASRKLNSLFLTLAALIWGTAFVAQSLGADGLSACAFTASRSFIAGFFLLGLSFVTDKLTEKKQGVKLQKPDKKALKTLIIGGICCGAALAIASTVQQFGIQYTTVGKAGFITTLYIIFVPIFGIFIKRKASPAVYISAVIAMAGLYLLCVTEKFTISKGDLYVLVCAVFFSFHILIIDRFSPKVNPIKLSCLQFFTAGIILLIPTLLFEKPAVSDILASWKYLLYTGILSSGIAFTLQIVAQKNINPTVASLLMSLESVFSALSGWLILNQKLSLKELCGCALVFIAIIITQISENKPQKDKNHKKQAA